MGKECSTYRGQERACRVLVGRPEGNRVFGIGYRSIRGRIILKWILNKWDLEVWTGLLWARIGTGAGGHL